MAGKKKFSFLDVFLTVLCVVFTCDAAAPAAAIGNSQFFYWLFLMVAFLLPYGFVVSELGTTYRSEGGLYDWVRYAYGDKWAARVAWCYWINYPIWLASMAVLIPTTLEALGLSLPPAVQLALDLAYIWIVVWLGNAPASSTTWLFNGVAVIKVAVALIIGVAGLWYATTYGFANPITIESLVPDLSNTTSLGYISIILFNFMGFEVVTTFADEMNNPSRDLPLAIIMGGFTIVGIYLFSSFGIGAGIPVSEISTDSGVTDALIIMLGQSSPVTVVVSVAFLVCLFGNGASWAFGVNSAAYYAAHHGNAPRIFGIQSKRTGMGIGVSIANGVVASLIVALQFFFQDALANMFWALFSMQLVFQLCSYIPMFPALGKLRKLDPNAPKTFTAPGRPAILKLITMLPVVEIVFCVVMTIVPLGTSDAELEKIPTLVGVLVFFVIGEVVRVVSARGREHEYRGLTPEQIAARDAGQIEL